MAEMEKLGAKYRIALRVAKDPRFERLPCDHKGTYADDCLVRRVTMVRLFLSSSVLVAFTSFPCFCVQHKCYIVATCDRDLKKRIRKIPGVPIMFIKNHQFAVERLPDVNSMPK